MIQRVQTVYLVLVVALSALLFCLPIAHFSADTYFFVYGLKSELPGGPNTSTWLLAVLLAFILLLTTFTITLYGNRPLQIKLCRFDMLVNIVLLVLMFYYADEFETTLNTVASYHLSSIFPVVNILLILLASRAIKKDELLVKSVDRIR